MRHTQQWLTSVDGCYSRLSNLVLGICFWGTSDTLWSTLTFSSVTSVVTSSVYHFLCARRSARSLSTSSMSCSRHLRCLRNNRRGVTSIHFVSESASWAAECTQCRVTPCFILSFITNASNNVLCSEHCGVVVLLMASYNDLQSTTAMLGVLSFKDSSGTCHLIFGSHNHAHTMRTHSTKSTAFESAYVSAARVLPTTRLTFLEYHSKGFPVVSFLSDIPLLVATIRQPFWDCCFSRDANDASEKDTNCNSFIGMGLMEIRVSLYFFASASKRLPSWRSFMTAWFILDWRKLSRADISGLVFVAAYCSDPINPLKPWRSFCDW